MTQPTLKLKALKKKYKENRISDCMSSDITLIVQCSHTMPTASNKVHHDNNVYDVASMEIQLGLLECGTMP